MRPRRWEMLSAMNDRAAITHPAAPIQPKDAASGLAKSACTTTAVVAPLPECAAIQAAKPSIPKKTG